MIKPKDELKLPPMRWGLIWSLIPKKSEVHALSEDYGSKHRSNVGGQHTHSTHYTRTTTTWKHASGNAAFFSAATPLFFQRQRRFSFLL